MDKLFFIMVLPLLSMGGYIPSRPRYGCPEDTLLLHPCECISESDVGISIKCENTNLAQAGVALNNLATLRVPIQMMYIRKCSISRLFGSLFYNLQINLLQIEDTPIDVIDDYAFLGVNNTLNELRLFNLSLKVFPTNAFQVLGNLTKLQISGHYLSELPKNAFASSISDKLVHLEITDGSLNFIPIESLQPLKKLKVLNLHNNAIQELKKNQFKGLREVEVLDLSFNNISRLDVSHVSDLIKLGWCNVSQNNLKELPRGTFARNSVLKLLNISHNKIKKLDSNSFRGLRFLRRLYISDNEINDIGRETFGTISKIGTIDLARNRLNKIDYQMFDNLKFVEVIDVSENQVSEIKKFAFRDLYLAEINLSKNNISKIQESAFQNCVNITVLDLSNNKLSEISPKSFDEVSYATELRLSHNLLSQMNQIPLTHMHGLKVLNVSYNQITTIPKATFPKLYELHTIDSSHNNLTEIFNAVFQTLFSLRTLDLSYNQLKIIKPGTFGTMPTLLHLNLNYNELEDIARSALTRLSSTRTLLIKGNNLQSLFQLPISVSHLDVSHNKLKGLPLKSWPSMNSLLSLDLSFNKIEDNLEKGTFESLLTLMELNLNFNGIRNVPWAALSDLSSLQHIHLKGNELSYLTRKAFGNLPVLLELDISLNSISNVSEEAFEGLLQLLYLNISHNTISLISNEAFKGLVSLKTLDLSFNKLEKLDNKSHGVLDYCLSLESLNISNNEFSSINKKTFPNDRYIPYKLNEIDLSFNFIPVLTNDLAISGGRFKKLNLSHNLISNIGKGVIGNLTQLEVIDLSFNKLEDELEEEFFNLSSVISEVYLSYNQLNDLPWCVFKKIKKLSVLDIRFNNFSEFSTDLQKLVENGTAVYFGGNPLICNCFVRPINRILKKQLTVAWYYKEIVCRKPHHLYGRPLFEVEDERLICSDIENGINSTRQQKDVTNLVPDIEFRAAERKSDDLILRWRILKNEDIANSRIIIKKRNDPLMVVYEEEVPYYQRKIIVPSKYLQFNDETEICILAKDSRGLLRGFYEQQCQFYSEIIKGGSFKIKCDVALVLSLIYSFTFLT
ncbi:toll-like receptor 7 isoform X1 [Agrilus planipennis]|uniref:Toll-like receptor 7 isoform X1 n=1 Tax=Agrilus planipennis TaxID=224129 RepID=A0A1W4XAP3_AGRPL|nr:toll-like receptor 7 isoform X1 [Agrilus planipennis]